MRLSKEVVAAREALTIELIKNGKGFEEIQAELASRSWAGRTGLRMSPQTLIRLIEEYAGRPTPELAPMRAEHIPASPVADGSIPAHAATPNARYRDEDGWEGVFVEVHKGLACFRLDDGRVFKLMAGERVWAKE